MLQRTINQFHEKLIVGSDITALAYAYEYRCPIIFLRSLLPYKNDQNGSYKRQIQLYKELSYSLLLNNQYTYSDRICSLRLENDVLRASTKDGFTCNIDFNHLFISDDYMLEGLPPSFGKTSDLNWVIDWFNVKNGTLHNFDQILDNESDFVKEVRFFYSDRFYKNSGRKDLLTLSLIKDEHLSLDDYNQNVARLKATKMMMDAGIKGIWDKTNGRFKKPILSSVKRDIHPLGKNKYPVFSNKITFLY